MIGGNKSIENESIALVKSAFREYYFNHTNLLETPEHLEQREFGYVSFGSGMIRHLSFRNKGDLIATQYAMFRQTSIAPMLITDFLLIPCRKNSG